MENHLLFICTTVHQYYCINDFIDFDDCSLSYSTTDGAYDFIYQMGPGTQLSKIDLKDAFKLIPVHPSQRNLLGICWKTIDTCLPFGLRLVLYLFNCLSEEIDWILVNNCGVHHLLHYLMIFSQQVHQTHPCVATTLIPCCKCINVPIKSSKIEGPSTSITFPGIHLNTVAVEARITPDRKEALLAELNQIVLAS